MGFAQIAGVDEVIWVSGVDGVIGVDGYFVPKNVILALRVADIIKLIIIEFQIEKIKQTIFSIKISKFISP